MKKQIIIRPILSEKSETLTEQGNKYVFVVDRRANKIEIGKEVERLYGVQVEAVNTMVMPGKSKVRNTRTGVQRGRVSSYKKAVITLVEGEDLNIYGEA